MSSPHTNDTYSPVHAVSPVDSPVDTEVISPTDVTSVISRPQLSSPISTAPTQINVSLPVKAELPDEVTSDSTAVAAYNSTIYSPVNSTAANVGDGDCCNNFSLRVRRQRLRPWLIAQINSGEIPGLVWLDKENMIFKIPWKHFGRPGVDTYLDALLFRRWAMHTKKFEQGQPADISTWKTRFRCALHKLPDIEELNKQNVTEGEEPYRVYKFRKIELEKIPWDCLPDEDPESSLGSPISASHPLDSFNSSSPVSASYPTDTPNSVGSSDIFKSPTDTNRMPSSIGGGHGNPEVYSKQGISDNISKHLGKRPIERSDITSADIHKWQCFDHIRERESSSYQAEKRSLQTDSSRMGSSIGSHGNTEEFRYDDEDKGVRRNRFASSQMMMKEGGTTAAKYSDYETDDDDRSWTSCSSSMQPNHHHRQPQHALQSIPSIVPRYTRPFYSESPSSNNNGSRGFEPFERQDKNKKSNEIGVIRNTKSASQKTPFSQPDAHEEDDNELFFQSCAKRIKKLDSKSSGYLKLKILEQFYYVENFHQNQYKQSHQPYRYSSDPPPLISSANVRTDEQLVDVDVEE